MPSRGSKWHTRGYAGGDNPEGSATSVWKKYDFYVFLILILAIGVPLLMILFSGGEKDDKEGDPADAPDLDEAESSDDPPATTPPPPAAPSSCEVSNWSAWSECSCLNQKQTRTRAITKHGPNCPSTSEERRCSRSDCPEWFSFNNTYISDGEYYRRYYTPTQSACYSECEQDPNCAAVYAYDGPETRGRGVECSYVSPDKIPLLYRRHGSMTRFNPNNRYAFVHRTKAGQNFNPRIGTLVQ